MKTLVVAGARPNFVKIAPIVRALRARGASVVLVHTGQHYDQSMSDVFFEDLAIPRPDHALMVGSGSHAQQTAAVMVALEPVLRAECPDVVIVVGDVNSTLAAALVAAKLPLPIAHVEAGLRSGDWTMPEEVNRVVVDRISDVLLAPSEDAVSNLLAEGLDRKRIHLVGNVMADSLLDNLDRAREQPILGDLGLQKGGFVLVTLHRPALVDNPLRLQAMAGALAELSEHRRVIWPVHPRTRSKLADMPAGVDLLEPLGYLDFVALESSAQVVITDSGGVQEETTILGVPCLTARDTTERPITVTEGTNRLIGPYVTDLLDHVVAAATLRGEHRPALWDGKTAERIVLALEYSISYLD